MSDQKALIVVDVQNDFMDDGNLPVPGSYDIIPTINNHIYDFERSDNLVVATQDWHPANHGSFASNHDGKEPFQTTQLDGLDQILWPDHCVQMTEGSEFVEALRQEAFKAIFRKGMDPKIDSYSGFYDNDHRRSTGLTSYLRGQGISDVYIAGVASDVCVKFTALDAVRENFNTHVIREATAGVEMEEGDIEEAFREMSEAGVEVV